MSMSGPGLRVLEALKKHDWKTIYENWYELPGDMRARLTRLLMTAMSLLPEELKQQVPEYARRLYEELRAR